MWAGVAGGACKCVCMCAWMDCLTVGLSDTHVGKVCLLWLHRPRQTASGVVLALG